MPIWTPDSSLEEGPCELLRDLLEFLLGVAHC